MLTSVLSVLHRYPEVLSWDYQWFQADEEICTRVHTIAKIARPAIESGRHVDHQRSSWDIFYRSAMTYAEMAENADFVKPILYHDAMGPRLRWWVLERLKDRLLNDLTLEQSLDLFYSTFGHDATKLPKLNELDSVGLGPEYVYRETLFSNDRRVQHRKIKVQKIWLKPSVSPRFYYVECESRLIAELSAHSTREARLVPTAAG